MTCASCVAHVSRALKKVPGVTDASVNLATEQAFISHDAGVAPSDLIAAVERAGYGAALGEDVDEKRRDAELARKRRLLVLSAALFIPTLILGMTPVEFPNKEWLLFALTLPVWLVVGGEFHRGALAALRTRTSNMDTLVSLGSTAAFAYSIYATVAGQPAYYETASAIVTLVFAGKYLEAAAKTKSNRAIRALLDLRPLVARVRDGDGVVREIPIDDVRPGQTLLVAAGDAVPIDGVVLEGSSEIDASMLTGEAMPVSVLPGDEVKQGTLNGDGALVVRAQTAGSGTTLARIVELVRRAQGTTPAVQRLADRVAGIFVPVILVIAALTFTGWLFAHHPWPIALTAAVAVLVVACPCALGLATPTAIVAAVGAGAKRGLLFRNADALERLASVTTVLFDKTGTLTLGKPQVVAVYALPGSSEHEVLANAAAVESASKHPVARAIVESAAERGLSIAPAAGVVTERGRGVQGRVDGETIFAGSEAFAFARGFETHALPPGDGSRVYVGNGAELFGAIDLGDAVRPEAADAVSRLEHDGIEVQIVSGDAEAPTRAVAQQLGVQQWRAQALPEQKAEIVRELRDRGERVAFAGDGINDAAALATADVGLAMGGGAEIALESAHVAILSNDPRAVASAIELSRATLRTVRQNLFWAFIYNAVLVPLAAFGIVHPIFAAAAMGASSLFVVGNSLLLQRKSNS